jgi:hypothetical protein
MFNEMIYESLYHQIISYINKKEHYIFLWNIIIKKSINYYFYLNYMID